MDSNAHGWKKKIVLQLQGIWRRDKDGRQWDECLIVKAESRSADGLERKKLERGWTGEGQSYVWKLALRPQLNSEEQGHWGLARWAAHKERAMALGRVNSLTLLDRKDGFLNLPKTGLQSQESYLPSDPWSMFTTWNHCLCQLTTIVFSVSEIESVIPRNVEGKTSKQLFNYQPTAEIWQLIHSWQTTHTVKWRSFLCNFFGTLHPEQFFSSHAVSPSVSKTQQLQCLSKLPFHVLIEDKPLGFNDH